MVRSATKSESELDYRDLASISKRFGAASIDACILLVLCILTSSGMSIFLGPFFLVPPLFYDQGTIKSEGDSMLQLWIKYFITLLGIFGLPLLMFCLYTSIMESTPLQATLGKLAAKIRVCNKYGDKLSFPRSLLRNLIKTLELPFFWIFIFVPLFTNNKKSLHDLAAHTVVVKNVKYYGNC